VALIASDWTKRREIEGSGGLLRLRWLFDPGFCAAVGLRLCTGCHTRGWVRLARLLAALDYLLFKIQIDPATRVGPRLLLRRALGVVLIGAPTLGADVVLSEVVSIGELSRSAPASPTVIGDGVVVEPGSYIAAGSNVGTGCVVGANCVIDGCVPAFHEVSGAGISPLQVESAEQGPAGTESYPDEPRVSLRQTLSLIGSDLRRRATDNRKSLGRVALELPLTPAALVTLGYRISHFCWQHHLRWAAYLIRLNSIVLYGSDIHPAATIGPGLFMSHSLSTSVGRGVRMGECVFLCPHSSVDRRAAGPDAGARYPIIGSHTFLGDRSCILGDSRVGNDTLLGSTATVVDVSFGSAELVVGSPATSRPLRGRFDDPATLRPEPERQGAQAMAAAGDTGTWRQTRALIRSDREAWRRPRDPDLESNPTPGTRTFARTGQAVMRIQNHLHARQLAPLARILFMWNLATFGFEIVQGISIGPRFRITGCFGSIVRGELIVGAGVAMGGNMSLGGNLGKTGMPVIGDGVILRSGTSIYGPVDVGERTIIALNAVLMSSVPSDVYTDGRSNIPLG